MNVDLVFDRFTQLAGLLPVEAGEWKPLCSAAAAAIDRMRLITAPAEDERLILAAAGEACYRHALARQEAQSVSVGGVSISQKSGGIEGARALREELLAGAAGLLECGFAGLIPIQGKP